jgi:predicted enzyme related to lactoylglutathione lyase
MPDNTMARHAAFSWCELMTTDVQAATRFYTALLGWTTAEVPSMDYTVVHAGGTGIGGMVAIPSHATARKAQELGATTIVPLTDIPNVGRFYTFQDPQGAIISVMTYRLEGAPS